MGTLVPCPTGKSFNRLTIIDEAGINKFRQQLWSWKCKCGKKGKSQSYLIRIGRIKSCGCIMRKYPLPKIGDKQGMLTVVKLSGHIKKGSGTYFIEVKCSGLNYYPCNKTYNIEFGSWNKGTKGCPTCCQRGEPFSNNYHAMIVNDKDLRSINKILTFKEYQKIMFKNHCCFYCWNELTARAYQQKRGNGGHGLDRLDHDGQHSLNNVVPCCGPCNTSIRSPNSNMSAEEVYVFWEIYRYPTLPGAKCDWKPFIKKLDQKELKKYRKAFNSRVKALAA